MDVSIEHAPERLEGPPGWIAPTPKYDYDPKLMIVRPREERLKEHVLKRKQEAAKYLAKQQAGRKAKQNVAQQRCYRQLVVRIDYSILHIMREPNVKDLARYINQHIGDLPRAEGKPPFGFVPTSKIQRTLDIADIGKVRGRRRRDAAA